MKYDEFIGHVQNRAPLPSRGDAERLTRVVLENLGARLQEGEADDLASQLPQELGRHLLNQPLEKYDLNELFLRVGESEGVDQPEAAYRTRVVFEVLMEAASIGEIKDVLDQLPTEFSRLFVGAKGSLPAQDVPYDQIRRVQESLHAVSKEKVAKAKAEQVQPAQAERGAGLSAEEARWQERKGEEGRLEGGRGEEGRGAPGEEEKLSIERSMEKWEEAYPGGESRGRQEQGKRSRGESGR